MKPVLAEIYSKSTETDSENFITAQYTPNGNAKGIFLPLEWEIKDLKQGVSTPKEFNFLTKETKKPIVEGCRLKINGAFYDVLYVANYIKILDTKIKLVE